MTAHAVERSRIDWSVRQVAVPWSLDDVRLPVERLRESGTGGRTMGTTWSVRLAGGQHCDAAAFRPDVQARLDEVDGQMSHWLEDSDLSRFNRSTGTWQPLPELFAEVLASALRVARDSDGAFDPTIGPVVNLWGFGPSPVPLQRPPSETAIAEARGRCGWRRIEMADDRHRARQPGGVCLDLSAIAKGFAVDRVAEYLEEQMIESYLVEVGGELRGRGVKGNGQPWWVAVERPDHAEGTPGCDGLPDVLVALHNLSIATSGDYRRSVTLGGRRYSHTIDPRTGCPVTHDLTSVTVVDRRCMMADAQATLLTVLGPDEGLLYAHRHDVAALFVSRVDDAVSVRASAMFQALLQ